MDKTVKYLGFLMVLTILFNKVFCETFNVKIATDSHINVVDSRFLSFTVDPKYLFTTNDIYNSKECVCMASALSPAYIRIAGPTTTQLSFTNHSIAIQPAPVRKITLTDLLSKSDKIHEHFNGNSEHFNENNEFTITFGQWKKFAQWSKNTGFDLVFGLNNAERTKSGLWDSNNALNVLSFAEQSNVDNVVWQLGYECQNQTIEEYINDLETLRLLIESFPRDLKWRIVGGDVTPCLKSHSKSDFKDYVTLSNDMFDAVFLDGNSTSNELEKMPHKDRLKLLTTLSNSDTPLWLSESSSIAAETELQRASSWMYSLGQSARNGFSVHFRESKEEELLRPTKSFYMALLYKNLVGDRVLDVNVEPSSEKTFLFAHCTSLRHQPVPGAVTLFGANMADETARFSLKMSKREEGGDIMQFILGSDINGNIMVNGRAMYYEGDIRPIVKRVRPYKTLLINLPPKSFGFWVLANTKVEACQETNPENNLVEAETVTETNLFNKQEEEFKRDKRDVQYSRFTEIQPAEAVTAKDKDNSETLDIILKRVENLNKDLKVVHDAGNEKHTRHERVTDLDAQTILDREKRQVNKENGEIKDVDERKKLWRPFSSISRNAIGKRSHTDTRVTEPRPRSGIVAKILQLNNKLYKTMSERRKNAQRSKLSKRSPAKYNRRVRLEKKSTDSNQATADDTKVKSRTKRSIGSSKKSKKEKFEEDLKEVLSLNEIDFEGPKFERIGKILHKIKEELNTNDNLEPKNVRSGEGSDISGIEEQFTVKTKISDDDTSISFSEKSKDGFLKSTFSKMVDVLDDLNNKVNNLVNSLNFLE